MGDGQAYPLHSAQTAMLSFSSVTARQRILHYPCEDDAKAPEVVPEGCG